MEYKEALHKAAALCSSGERCEHDIREKLLLWGMSDNDATKIINYLIQEKFLDEKRFAEFFTKDKFRFNKWGKIKIAYMLKQKHISSSIIQEALNSIDDEEYYSALQELMQSKLKQLKYKDKNDKRTKLFRFAQSRGFESQLIKSEL